MKVLVVASSVGSPPSLEYFWQQFSSFHEVTYHYLNLSKKLFASDFYQYVKKTDFSIYDRVIVQQNLRRINRQYTALRLIPNLVFFETDACQNYIPESKFYKKFDAIFRDIGAVRVVVTSLFVQKEFSKLGIDCKYLPKACDESTISNLEIERDIEFGFIGKVENRVYKKRRKILDALKTNFGLKLFRTEPGVEYNLMLNHIRFFFSADIGFNEYMFKNFEAMCAGCVVFAKRQPEYEQKALGFIDMENIVLYDSLDEIQSKYCILKNDSALTEKISRSARQLILEQHTFRHRAESLAAIVIDDIGGG